MTIGMVCSWETQKVHHQVVDMQSLYSAGVRLAVVQSIGSHVTRGVRFFTSFHTHLYIIHMHTHTHTHTGNKWPKNAETPGIFKIHRGSNRNEIESGETVFSLVTSAPSIGSLKNAFKSSDTCDGMVSEKNDALRCISVTNRDLKCELKNKCRDQVVTILKST